MRAAGEIFERDIAAGPAIGGDEALRLVAGEIGLQVLVVVHGVAVRLEPDRRRQLHLFAALEDQERAAFRHGGFALPI